MVNILTKPQLGFDDVALYPIGISQVRSRADVDLTCEYLTPVSNQKLRLCPVICTNMDTIASFPMATALSEHGMMTALHKYHPAHDIINFYKINPDLAKSTFISIGIGDSDLDKLKEISDACEIYNILIDVANGYMYDFLKFVHEVRLLYPYKVIMAGNVCTAEGALSVWAAGADVVRCGIAGGGACNTKNKAGIYWPQFSMITKCAEAADEHGFLICSDGGCNQPADFCKAIAGGAHMVCAGTIFAGHDECDAEWEMEPEVIRNMNPARGEGFTKYTGRQIKKAMKFYGMSSKTANDKYNGGLSHYRTSEGKELMIPYKGPVVNLIQDIKGSLASCCTYNNCNKLQKLIGNGNFIRVTK